MSTKNHYLAIFRKILNDFFLFAVSICIRMLTKMPPVRYERDEDERKTLMPLKQITQAIQWRSQNCFISQRFQGTAAYLETCKIICIQNCRFSPFFRGKLQIFGHWSLIISTIPILIRNYGKFAIRPKKKKALDQKMSTSEFFHTEFTKV